MPHVTKKQILLAKQANLHAFCLDHHPESFTQESKCIRLNDNHSLVIAQDWKGYYDFANGEHGDSIDFLMRYFKYDFAEAVEALAAYAEDDDPPAAAASVQRTTQVRKRNAKKEGAFVLPPKGNTTEHVYRYLYYQRWIPEPILSQLFDQALLYEDAHRHCIFVNSERTVMEAHETDKKYRYKQSLHAPDHANAFWWVKSGKIEGKPSRVYICESAIDACSLYALHAWQYKQDPATSLFPECKCLYVSISGVGNFTKIDRILSDTDVPVYLAVDNDNAGRELLKRYESTSRVIPCLPPDPYKDWNEILVATFREWAENEEHGYSFINAIPLPDH